MSVVYLVRHGQASFEGDDYDRLSETGLAQARLVGETLASRGVEPQLLVSGGLVRHRTTAEQLSAGAGWSSPFEVDPDWDELDYVDVIAAHHPAYTSHAAIISALADDEHPGRAFQGLYETAVRRWVDRDGRYGESHDAFQGRVAAAFERLAGRLTPTGAAVVVTSGGPITAVTAAALGLPDHGWGGLDRVIANGSLTRMRPGRDRPALLTFNEIGHLAVNDRLTYR